MSLGQAIAPHLPYLRRYGRAISGSQQSGDTEHQGVASNHGRTVLAGFWLTLT